MHPFTTYDGEKADFYGVVTFEVDFDQIGGIECSNSLIENFSRLVLEAKTLRKKAFKSLDDFFAHYELPTSSKKHYWPSLNKKDGKIEVRTASKTLNTLDSGGHASPGRIRGRKESNVSSSPTRPQKAQNFEELVA